MKQLLLCLYLLSSLSAIASPATVIDREITKLAALYTDGFGYNNAKMRRVIFGSLFEAEERQAAVAFFSLGGVDNSNVHFEYIAIFAQGLGRDFSNVNGPKERPFHLVTTAMVGSRGTRILDWETARISKGQIVVQGTRWAEGDAGCCPTKPIEVTFNIPTKLVDELTPEPYPVLRESEGPGLPKPQKPSRPAVKKDDKPSQALEALTN